MRHVAVINTCMKVDVRLIVRHGLGIAASSKKKEKL